MTKQRKREAQWETVVQRAAGVAAGWGGGANWGKGGNMTWGPEGHSKTAVQQEALALVNVIQWRYKRWHNNWQPTREREGHNERQQRDERKRRWQRWKSHQLGCRSECDEDEEQGDEHVGGNFSSLIHQFFFCHKKVFRGGTISLLGRWILAMVKIITFCFPKILDQFLLYVST